MEWSKIKTIILIILVGTNLLLLSFVLRQDIQAYTARRQARQDAITFLQNNGVAVDESIVPQEMELTTQEVQRDRDSEPKLAQALLGSSVEERNMGGEVYRYYNQDGYIQFHGDGTFQGEFVDGLFPCDAQSVRSYSVEILQRLNFQGEIQSVSGDTEIKVVMRQVWDSVPLFDRQVTLTYRGGCLVSMTGGRRLNGTPQESGSRQTMQVPTALFRFYHGLTAMGDVCSRIDSITQGYIGATYSPGPSLLLPVWQITTDTGTYLLNTVTGEVSSTESTAAQQDAA